MTYSVGMQCTISLWHSEIRGFLRYLRTPCSQLLFVGCFHLSYWTLRGSVNSNFRVPIFKRIVEGSLRYRLYSTPRTYIRPRTTFLLLLTDKLWKSHSCRLPCWSCQYLSQGIDEFVTRRHAQADLLSSANRVCLRELSRKRKVWLGPELHALDLTSVVSSH
jgi:hypothetical protein